MTMERVIARAKVAMVIPSLGNERYKNARSDS